ncbi:hypothetical protein BHM03_00060865 [Ensete ventricosum]|nr:hypothetical protein BHM03_00060865 [Ensete ventricosum]
MTPRRLKEKERTERSLLAALCSERLLLAALCNERSLLAVIKAHAVGCERSLLATAKVGDSVRLLLAAFEVLVLEAIPYLVAIGVAMSDDVIVLGNLSGEIVYPCILDPDGEDEGGQASSSLAISTRWISAVKLLPSDLATLAQREGGE